MVFITLCLTYTKFNHNQKSRKIRVNGNKLCPGKEQFKNFNFNGSTNEVAVSMEEEQKIYETLSDNEEDYGPIYCEPPTEEEKLYAVFEGKKLHKLCHKDIR